MAEYTTGSFEALKEWVDCSWKAQASWREAAEDDYAFFDGHQWTEDERADLKESSRVPIVFNRVAVIINSVAGTEINNRTEVRFIPREIGDAKPNEVLTAGAEWFRDLANAEDQDSEAFRDVLISGLGFTNTTLDFEDDPEGEPEIERIDPLEMGWDHHAHRKGLTDARYFFRVQEMPCEEAEDRFSGYDKAEIHADWLSRGGDETTHHNVAGDEYRDGSDDDPENKDTLTVITIQWKERVRTVEYADPQTGQRAEMPKSKWDEINKRMPIMVPHRVVSKWEWKQAFLGRDEILEENQPDPDGPTFNAITGHWDRKDKRFYGLLKSMRDPQKYANKWLSQTLHIINSNAKGGVMVEAEAVDDTRQFEESWAAADGVTWLKSGALAAGRLKEKPQTQMPSALMGLTEFAISAIRDSSGVNLELLGLRDANQPGVLEYQRRQSAMTTMAGFFDSLRFYRKRQGHTILNFLRNHIAPTGRLVRIMKEDQAQYVPLAMEGDTRKYDVIVDDAPQAPNEKEKAWSVIEAMMPMLQNAELGLDDWADILEYSPLPSSFAEKVRQKAIEQKKEPDPMQQIAQEMGQAELQKTQSEAMENQAQAMLDQARAQQIGVETKLAPVEAASSLASAMQPPRASQPSQSSR